MSTCKLCGNGELNGSGAVYCPRCSQLYTLSVQPRRELDNAAREDAKTRHEQTVRALELWQEMGDEARILLGAKIAIFQQQTNARGMGAISVLEMLVRLMERGYV